MYLMAIQCAGSLPPQETGLTFNSWYGKFHLEMHWWHGVHFPLWGRAELFEKKPLGGMAQLWTKPGNWQDPRATREPDGPR